MEHTRFLHANAKDYATWWGETKQAIISKYWTWSTDIDNISGKYKGGGINNKKHYQFEAILSENSLFYWSNMVKFISTKKKIKV